MGRYKKDLLIILAVVVLLFAPALFNPQLLLGRNNDLTEFFWPIFDFVKKEIIYNKTFPLWNNFYFSGMPLLADPQSPLFYLPNIIFLILPMSISFFISFFLHAFLGGIGAYFLANKGFNFKRQGSLIVAILYLLTPRFSTYLEAGHFGLIAATAWIPFVALSVVMLVKKANFYWALLFCLSLSSLFFTHTTTFIFAVPSSIILYLSLLLSTQGRTFLSKSFLLFFVSYLLTFGLIAVTLLPQISWLPDTTRFLLTRNPDVYPKWISLKEYAVFIFNPLVTGKENLWTPDSEKWITIGMSASLLSFLGFLKLKRKYKILILLSFLFIGLVSLNNLNPLNEIFVSQSWYSLARVSTRIWFIVVVITSLLAGYAFERFNRNTSVKFLLVIAFFELLVLSWLRLARPYNPRDSVDEKIINFLSSDKSLFRVFCLDRCIPQKVAQNRGFQLVEGYGTLQQTNYFKHSWDLTKKHWDYYTLSIPPIGIYTFEEIQPSSQSLGFYNVKYIIAPYKLEDKNFSLVLASGKYFVYENKKNLPRAYFVDSERNFVNEAKILTFSPNKIEVDTSDNKTGKLVLSEVFSPGWKAYLDGKEEVSVQETPESLRFVDLNPRTKSVTFIYEPLYFKEGKLITVSTILFIAGYLILLKRRRLFPSA